MTSAVATATTVTEQLLDTTTTITTASTTTSSERFLTAIQEPESGPPPQRYFCRRWDITATLCPHLLILAAAYTNQYQQYNKNGNTPPATSQITSTSPAPAPDTTSMTTKTRIVTLQQFYQLQEALKLYH
jgi:hypothetical protein